MSQSLSKDFWINTFLPFSAAMAASGTLIPLFILFMGGSASSIGWLSALSSCVSLPLAFFWGKLTDDSGKRKIFILIMFISGFGIIFGYFLTGLIPGNFTWLIFLAILSGLLLGA
ncbi:MAG: MFS transporter, partial [Candidatus Helarchaeota archaeon]